MTGKEAVKKLQKQYDRINQYTRDNYDRISVTVPKGMKDKIKLYLTDGQTVNGLINALLCSWLQAQETETRSETEQRSIFDDFPTLED